MLTPRSAACRRGQWSLVGSLVAVAILIALAAVLIPRLIRPASTTGADTTAIDRANGAACTIYQSQINQAASMYRQDNGGQPPRSLDDLKKYGVTDDMIHSPGCTYQLGPTPSASPGAPAAAPAPVNGQRGPGGVTIPNIPGSGGQPGSDGGE